ncbi:MAG: DUF1501 domain-containing protein [Pirellulales bacterium]|nr:DUF1501 domain-containing protein [Pirellulales bacterium]
MPHRACRNYRLTRACSRRELLRAGGASLLGLSLADLLRGRAVANDSVAGGSFGRAKRCILLFMWGGPAQQDTWDLKPLAPAEVRGEFQPIATRTPGIEICEHFPRLAQRSDHLAIIRSMTHNNVDHLRATHFLLTGQPPPVGGDFAHDWPSMGAVLARLGRGRDPLPPFVSMRPKLPNDVPRFVEESHGQFAGWLGAAYDPLSIDADPSRPDYRVGDFERPAEISVDRLDDRRALLTAIDAQRRATDESVAGMSRHYQRAFDMLNSAVGRGAFRLEDEPAELRERYGLNPHGQSVLQARRLIERDVPLVTIFWPNDGIKNVSVYWDTHSRNFVDLKERLMPVADQAFSALLDDLSQRGLLEETLVIWTGEFGRTPKIGQVNSDAGAGADGRDHWPHCFTSVLAGGGVRGGQVYGASDRFAAYPAANPVRPVDLTATAYHLLGVPSELTLQDRSGRPLVVCPGTPLHDLLV